MSSSAFKVDSALRMNVTVALLLIIICPIALWQLYFRHDPQEAFSLPQSLSNYLIAADRPAFSATNFFAEKVFLFETLHSPSRQQIDSAISSTKEEYMYPRTTVDKKSIVESKDEQGNQTVSAWSSRVSYRKSLMKYEVALIHHHVTFDATGKIISLEILEEKAPTYSSTLPK